MGTFKYRLFVAFIVGTHALMLLSVVVAAAIGLRDLGVSRDLAFAIAFPVVCGGIFVLPLAVLGEWRAARLLEGAMLFCTLTGCGLVQTGLSGWWTPAAILAGPVLLAAYYAARYKARSWELSRAVA